MNIKLKQAEFINQFLLKKHMLTINRNKLLKARNYETKKF